MLTVGILHEHFNGDEQPSRGTTSWRLTDAATRLCRTLRFTTLPTSKAPLEVHQCNNNRVKYMQGALGVVPVILYSARLTPHGA
ncbi:MAG: hypothetical protein ACKO3T_23705, partial [Planctomycetaceae bacterium]